MLINESDLNAPLFTGKHFDHHKTNFHEENIKDGLKQHVTGTDTKFKKVGNRDFFIFALWVFHTSIVILRTVPVPCLMQPIKSANSSPQKKK